MNNKKTFIRDIREKDAVTGNFLVTKKESGLSKSGKPYLNLRIMDSTGELEARVWDNAEELGAAFKKDDVVSLKGHAVAYQGGIQVNVSAVKALSEGEYSIRDFLPASKKDPSAMMAELQSIINSLGNPHLKALLEAVFSDADVKERFKTAPAAKSMHHPYLSGLLEHVLSICGLADRILAHYGGPIDRDLLISGAILHDIGKIFELSYRRSFDYTDEGRLLGHITLGIELIERKISGLPGFPRELSILLRHMLLSHHGHLEFGSPKRPKTIEALILYYLDDLDAKVNAIQTIIGEKDGSSWSSYQRIFERYIFKGYDAPPEGQGSEALSGELQEGSAASADKGPLKLF